MLRYRNALWDCLKPWVLLGPVKYVSLALGLGSWSRFFSPQIPVQPITMLNHHWKILCQFVNFSIFFIDRVKIIFCLIRRVAEVLTLGIYHIVMHKRTRQLLRLLWLPFALPPNYQLIHDVMILHNSFCSFLFSVLFFSFFVFALSFLVYSINLSAFFVCGKRS